MTLLFQTTHAVSILNFMKQLFHVMLIKLHSAVQAYLNGVEYEIVEALLGVYICIFIG